MNGRVRQVFIVLDDLSGPDPRIGPGTAAILQTTQPLLYEGHVYLVAHEMVYQIIQKGDAIEGPCTFEHLP